MIVKIHSRGAGAGSGPVDYLLGKERDREKAVVLRGEPERIRQLIDGCDFPAPTPPGCCRSGKKTSLTMRKCV